MKRMVNVLSAKGLKKIYLDAGHGLPEDPGAVGNSLKEAEVVLKIQELFVAHLKANYTGFELNYTRTDNKTFLELAERASKANKWEADVFVSFHNNSATAAAHGYEDFIHESKSSGSTKLQDAVHAKVLPVLKKYGISDRGQKTANYAVLRLTSMPAILTESLFLSNVREAGLLKDANVLKDFAAAYADGVASYLGLAKKVTAPTVTPSKPASNDTLYRVVAGSFADRKNAEDAQAKLKKAGFDSFILPEDK
jgi:N-acetylmuramoyl-L-alanine amidase